MATKVEIGGDGVRLRGRRGSADPDTSAQLLGGEIKRQKGRPQSTNQFGQQHRRGGPPRHQYNRNKRD